MTARQLSTPLKNFLIKEIEMRTEKYNQRLEFLQSVLKDAKERGDYHLECDTEEKIYELNSDYHEGYEMK
jgi:hypothetical protein